MNDFPRQMTQPSGQPLVLDPTRLMLQFRQPVERNNLLRLLSEIGLQLEEDTIYDPQTQRPVQPELVNHSTTRFFVRSQLPITEERYQYIRTSAIIFGLDFVAPVYRVAGQTGRRALVTPLPNVLVVRLRQQTGAQNVPPELNLPPILAAAQFPANAAPRIQEVPAKSRYLNGFRYYTILNPEDVNAYQLRAILEGDLTRQVLNVQFENVPLINPQAAVPADVLVNDQWNLFQIGAVGPGFSAWDILTEPGRVIEPVVVAIIDDGVDRGHPDLALAGPGINITTGEMDGSPVGGNAHGTQVAGIVGALANNMLGIAGVAPGARILPIAVDKRSDVEVAMGIHFARENRAQVILIPLAATVWARVLIDEAIDAAFSADIVLVAPTGNTNTGTIAYPASNPKVIAVGASNRDDERVDPASGATLWGSNYGTQLSVVAPGIGILSTDPRGTAGRNNMPGPAGDFYPGFEGTSAAAAHVAGLAALLRAVYPGLTNVQVRNLIERSAVKVGEEPYGTDRPGGGSWNPYMGYGRINVLRALDTADLLIRDNLGDTGMEPSPGPFWNSPDIILGATVEGIGAIQRGVDNVLYVRVTNNGPRTARNVRVSVRLTAYVGLEFVYPYDWTVIDPLHLVPASGANTVIAQLAPNTSVLAQFTIPAAQTHVAAGWGPTFSWHPCILASVQSENDYAFTVAPLTASPIAQRLSNLAQKNVTVVDLPAPGATTPGTTVPGVVIPGTAATAAAVFPFVAGSRFNRERSMTLTIDRGQVPPGTQLLLSLDDDGSAFPLLDFTPPQRDPDDVVEQDGCGASALVFLQATRIQTQLGCSSGIITLAPGSRFDCAPVTTPGRVEVVGGEVITRGNRRFVIIVAARATVRIEKAPNQLYPMSLHTTLPATVVAGQQFSIDISQQNTQGVTVGGATVIYRVVA